MEVHHEDRFVNVQHNRLGAPPQQLVLSMSLLNKTESPAETSGQSNESLRANSRQRLLPAVSLPVPPCALSTSGLTAPKLTYSAQTPRCCRSRATDAWPNYHLVRQNPAVTPHGVQTKLHSMQIRAAGEAAIRRQPIINVPG